MDDRNFHRYMEGSPYHVNNQEYEIVLDENEIEKYEVNKRNELEQIYDNVQILIKAK